MKTEGMYQMNEKLVKNVEECYRLAEQRAAHYFETLYTQLAQKSYISTLKKDIQSWRSNHIHRRFSVSSVLRRKAEPHSKDYYNYIQWLNYTGKLNNYLDRSVSYIFMRDLGKDLGLPETKERIQRLVDNLRQQLLSPDTKEKMETMGMVHLYRWAQKEGIESTIIWVIDKMKIVSLNLPKELDADQAQRKLIKIIAGVVMHVLEEMSDSLCKEERAQKLDEAIRLGYSYGLTYPFIDDLLDAKILSGVEKEKYTNLIRTALTTGTVPSLGEWPEKNADLIVFIHQELREAFEYIKNHQRAETKQHFFEQSYVFFHSQEVDREKDLFNASYTNKELLIPIILKSASSRLIARSVIGADEDNGFDERTFFYGIYNQLADDFTDMFDDMKVGAVTPYTYYLKHHHQRSDLINPFELYWTVINYLIHHVYHSNSKVCEVIISRAINSLKRFKERVGVEGYNKIMKTFAFGNAEFYSVIQTLVQKADDVDFLDKLLRDQMLTVLKRERQEREAFLDTVKLLRKEINTFLFINKDNQIMIDDFITDAANYSLKGNGKRLRPIMTWVVGIEGYGLEKSSIIPLLKSLEYMHTASLIFDDLPSQDNASTRHGRTTLHVVYNTAIAEITSLFLTQKAFEEQASLEQFDSKAVLKLIRYSAQSVMNMCRGQAMDLEVKGKILTLEQLKNVCFYKTGIAFEASLIMPAILAGVEACEMEALKKFAFHAGIAFQIKDDLLDVEGNMATLGKPIGQDEENNNSTFVTILGQNAARKEMWNQYCLAMEALKEVPRNTTFLKQLLHYFVNRNH